jgi:endonuclease YncB( thermonuclease family)
MKQKYHFFILFFLIPCILFAQKKGKVIVVFDGDTVAWVNEETQDTLRIRLHGVDAPEKVQPFGKESKEFATNLCLGKTVVFDSIDTDIFGRKLGKIITLDGIELNQELLKNGLAWHFKRYSKGNKDSTLYANLQKEAKEQKKGLWVQENPVPPWKYRSEIRHITGKVIGIKDGDSIELLVEDEIIIVDFKGVDCPEYKQPFGKEAVQFTRAMCMGKQVVLESAYENKYKKYLADVILPDGKNLSQEILKAGLGWHRTTLSKKADLYALEQQARKQKIGLWIQENPEAPWEYRKSQMQRK